MLPPRRTSLPVQATPTVEAPNNLRGKNGVDRLQRDKKILADLEAGFAMLDSKLQALTEAVALKAKLAENTGTVRANTLL